MDCMKYFDSNFPYNTTLVVPFRWTSNNYDPFTIHRQKPRTLKFDRSSSGVSFQTSRIRWEKDFCTYFLTIFKKRCHLAPKFHKKCSMNINSLSKRIWGPIISNFKIVLGGCIVVMKEKMTKFNNWFVCYANVLWNGYIFTRKIGKIQW